MQVFLVVRETSHGLLTTQQRKESQTFAVEIFEKEANKQANKKNEKERKKQTKTDSSDQFSFFFNCT